MSSNQYVKLPVSDSNNLPFDIAVKKEDLMKKPFGEIKVNGKILWLSRPLKNLGRKWYEKHVKRNDGFGIRLETDEIKILDNSDVDPFFETKEDYEKFLYSCLDEKIKF